MKSECIYYLKGAKMALSVNSGADLIRISNTIFGNLEREFDITSKNEAELREIIAILTLYHVVRSNDDKLDLNSIGWFMGLICHTITINYDKYIGKFDYLFEIGWNEYFDIEDQY